MSRPSPYRWLCRVLGRASLARYGRARRHGQTRPSRLEFEPLEGREMMSGTALVSLLQQWRVPPPEGGAATETTPVQVKAANSGSLLGLPWVFRDFYEVDNTPQQARNISTRGWTQGHTIHNTADVDWVKFSLTRRSDVVIETNGRSGDTEMWLFGPNGATSEIAYDNDGGSGSFSRIDCSGAAALDPGTYYVKVGEFGGDATISRYTIRVRATASVSGDAFENDNTPEQAKAILPDAGPQTHSIHVASDVDWATFTLAATSDVVIETRGTSGDTRLWLYGSDPAAAPIELDEDDGVGRFSVIVRAGDNALPAGTYYVKAEESGNNAAISAYTLSVTTLQQGDVLLVQGQGGVSAAIRWGESRELNVPLAETFSHAAVYVGSGEVAEMIADGFVVTAVADRYAESSRVDIVRHRDVGQLGSAVAAAAMSYAGTPYAFGQIGVFAAAALTGRPASVVRSLAWPVYQATDSGPRRMICSELVARAFADADASLTLGVALWPTLAGIGDTSEEFRMDFTSPTMLALSPDLQRLNA